MLNIGTNHPPVYSSLVVLLRSLEDEASSVQEVVETAVELVNSGCVVLTGDLTGCRLEH